MDSDAFVAAVDAWRAELELDHRRFAEFLGRPESEWSYYRTGARQPSLSFIGAVFVKADAARRISLQEALTASLRARFQPGEAEGGEVAAEVPALAS